MTKFIARQFNIGVGKEATRGTLVAASYWLPYKTLTIDDEIKVAKDEGVYGVIEKGVGQEVVFNQSKVDFDGDITDKGFGLLLKATLGSETSTSVSGDTSVKDHAFTVLQSAQHPSLTFSVVEPNSNSGSGYGYALGMIDSLEMMFEINKYSSYKVTAFANKGAVNADSTAYTVENRFRPQDGVFKLAANLSGLSGATAINIIKANVSIKKNVEPDQAIGSVASIDRLNKEFDVSGSLELKYSDRSMIDTYLMADLAQAMSFTFINSNVTIGSTSHPTLTVRLAKVKFESVARKIDPKNIVTQTVKFTAFYSSGDTEAIDITLRNLVVSAY